MEIGRNKPDEAISPVAFEGENGVLFTVDNEKTGLQSVVELDLTTGKRKTRWKNDIVSPMGGFSTVDGRGSVGLKTMPDSVQYHFIKDDGLEVTFLKTLLAKYPGRSVSVMNYTDDGQQAVVVISGDANRRVFTSSTPRTERSGTVSMRIRGFTGRH